MTDYKVSTDKNKLDLKTIHDFLSNRSYWAKDRSYETVRRSVENSLCFGIYDEADKLVGFARVLTDYAVFAYLMDVFILEDHRQKGLGKMLMDAIMSHPDLQGLRRIMLATKDAHGLYAQYGFQAISNAQNFMELVNSPQ